MKTALQLICAVLLIIVASVLHGMFKLPPPPKELTKADIANPGSLQFGPEFTLLLPTKDAEAMSLESGFIRLCDPARTAACLVLDKTPYEGTNLEAAVIAMRVYPDIKDYLGCISADREDGDVRTVVIGGVEFAVSENDEVGTGSSLTDRIYRTFYKDTCYEINSGITTSRYETEIFTREFSLADRAAVNAKLESVVNTFTFND